MTDNLTPTQEEILRSAHVRIGNKVLPFPPAAANIKGGAAAKVIESLLEKGFIEEIAEEEGEKNYTITNAGRGAIGVEPKTELEADDDKPSTTKQKKDKPSGKLGNIIDLMQRPEGATVQQIMDATGLQKHSVRGAISGQVKKKWQYQVDQSMNGDGEVVYNIVG